ncbi:unnamed protein product [Larinioides sclopetarius]|uniref:Cuticle protein n=1 Tax=Larinioides sclopetarius TaxID=280406 RepID=A0AAV2ATR6_9ARAC
MIAKVFLFCAALAAAQATYLAPGAPLGYAIKAPAAPLLHAPLLSKTVVAPVAPVYSKTVVAAPAAVTVQREVITNHAAAPIAVAAPIAYAKAPVYTTTITRTAPVAPVLGHTGLFGAAPLAYGLGYGHYGHGIAGHGLAYTTGIAGHGHGLAYNSGLVGLGRVGYSKYLL